MKKSYPLLMLLFIAVFAIPEINAQGTETFEGLPDDQDFFVRDGKTFTSNDTNFDVTTFANAGAGGSDKFMDNFGFTATNATYSISTGGPDFTMLSAAFYLSSFADANNPTNNGTFTVKGFEAGVEVFSYTKTSGFPITTGVEQGFFVLDFASDPPSSLSTINIDRLDMTLGGAFQYISLDNFVFGDEIVQNDPPFVTNLTVSGAPVSTATSVDFTVTFNEPAFNVDATDFAVDLVGTTGAISNVSGNGTSTITVTVSGISGEGTVSVDLIAGNNIADAASNSPAPPFTAGENFNASRCFVETFESFSGNLGANTFTSNGTPYATNNADFDITFFNNAGSSGSHFLDNTGDQGTGKSFSVLTPGPELFSVNSIDVYLSSLADGGDNPTNDGTLSIEGLLNGSVVYTISKNSGFPINTSINQGFTPIDFATEGASDFSSTNIDELRLTLGGAFIYMSLDDFEHCPEVLTTDPPAVQNITVVGNPPAASTAIDFNVVFNEDAFNVTADDFNLSLGGSTTGTIGTVSGSGNSYNVNVTGVSGEGAIRLDLLANTNIADLDGNTPPPPFINGESFLASLCNVETFETLADDANTWTNAGIAFNSTAVFNVDEFINAGAGASDRYLDNLADQGINKTYTIALTNAADVITMNQMAIYLSSVLNGENPSNDGSLSVLGRLDGATMYTITKTTGFPTSTSNGNNGFYTLDFSVEGGVDNSAIDIDEIVITIGGAFTYVAVDNFEFCTDPPPTAVCMPFTVALDASGNASIVPADVDGGSTDNSGSVTLVSVVPSTFDCSNIGDNTVTLTVADNTGQQSTCTAVVTVEDTIAPVIACPGPITMTNDSGVCGAVVNYAMPTITDNCSVTEPPAVIDGFATLGDFDGSRFYVSNITFTGAAAFNDAIAKGGFVATINDAAENQFLAATMNIAGVGTANIGFNDVATEGSFVWQSGSLSTFTNWNPGEPNNVGNEDYTQLLNNGAWNDIPDSSSIPYILELPIDGFFQTAGLSSGSEFPIGTTTNTFQYTDAGGNTDTCSFDVTIADSEAPVIACQDITVALDANGEYSLDIENYAVSQDGTFAPVDIAVMGTIVNLDDDAVSEALAVGFDFDFYGVTYSDFYISSNGFITFDASSPNGCCSGQLLPSAAAPNNLIAFAWEDLNPNDGGVIRYETTGVAPNRVLVMEVDALPHFGSANLVTAQVHLFEGSNKIEIHTTAMPTDGGAHTQGVENADGTLATFVDGRNANSSWSLLNDYVSFTPPAVQITDNCGVSSISLSQTEFSCLDAGSNPVTVTVTDVNGIMETCTFNVIVPGTTATYTAAGWMPSAPDMNTAAIFEADYNTATDGGSIDACGCSVTNSAELTIGTGDYLNVLFDIEVEATSKLTVAHEGSVVQINDNAAVTNDGTINVNLTTPLLKPRDFMIMGSPMTAETREGAFSAGYGMHEHSTANFTPHPDVAAEFGAGVVNWADAENNNWSSHSGLITPGEGYLYRPQANPADGDTTYDLTYELGTLNNGVVTFPIVEGDDKEDSPNVMANPYASAIFLDAQFFTENPTVSEVYFWEHVTARQEYPNVPTLFYSMDDVSVYNQSGGVAATNGGTVPNGFISTGQGFGVKANTGTGSSQVTFNNRLRQLDNNNTLRTTEVEKERLWLSIENAEYERKTSTLIAFNATATEGQDDSYDSNKLATVLSLYSHHADGSGALAIQSRESFDEEMLIPMGFSTVVDEVQEYVISIENVEGINLAQTSVYLMDHLLNLTTELNKGDYIFNSAKGIFNNRFTLYFSDRNVLDIEQLSLDSITMFPNPTDGQFTIVKPLSLVLDSLELHDITGRLILKDDLSSMSESKVVDINSLPSGAYICIFKGNGEELVKRIIKK